MATPGSNPSSVPTIVLSGGGEPPRYPALRFASKAFRIFAILEVIGSIFWMWPAVQVGLGPGMLAGLGVVVGAIMFWVLAELCDLGIELVQHLRAGGR